MSSAKWFSLAATALACAACPLAAQVRLGAQATALVTRADPVPGDSSLTEPRLVAPVLFASLEGAGGRLQLHAMLDGEGWTMRGGQLSPGAWGEGFFDRRHPHTWAHELIASWTAAASGAQWSVSGGKGFAPYGSDDPMSRPVLLYPVNHHWAQLLERAILIAGARLGPVTLEGGLFNGDEPERYGEWPRWSRFGDSWSVRALVHPEQALELQASFAHVKSPEARDGTGRLNEKVSVSARLERPLGPGTLYGLAEWTSNSEGSGLNVFHSALFRGRIPATRVGTCDERHRRPRPGDVLRAERFVDGERRTEVERRHGDASHGTLRRRGRARRRGFHGWHAGNARSLNDVTHPRGGLS